MKVTSVFLNIYFVVLQPEPTETELVYHAASPDERALVYGASNLGYVFKARTPNYVEIDALGVSERYEVLNVLEFTSTRKRMSVIVKCPDGKIRLYCKVSNYYYVIHHKFVQNNRVFFCYLFY